jgi:hypothetical protein
MPMVVPTVVIYFGIPAVGADFFTLDDPVRGVLDNATFRLGGDLGIDVASPSVAVTITRGRSRELDEFQTGTAVVTLENFGRIFDGLNSAGIYYGDLTPGKRVTIGFHGVTVFEGTLEDWDVDWPVNAAPTATFTAVDALGDLARMEFDAWTANAGDTAGPRLTSILNRPEVHMGLNRRFDSGISVLQGNPVTWGSNVLSEAQLVVKSDGGRFYASRDGALVFKDRHSMFGAAPAATFRDDLTGINFYGITTQTGSELLFNRVGVDRDGGILQTVEDATSVAEYGTRSLSMSGLLMDTDAQAADMAGFLLSIYKDPTTRIASITVNVSDLTDTQRGTVTALDIGDLVRVLWTPRGIGAQVDQTLAVEGVDHYWTSGQVHMMTVSTSTYFQSDAFRLDDPLYGVLDLSPLAF